MGVNKVPRKVELKNDSRNFADIVADILGLYAAIYMQPLLDRRPDAVDVDVHYRDPMGHHPGLSGPFLRGIRASPIDSSRQSVEVTEMHDGKDLGRLCGGVREALLVPRASLLRSRELLVD